MIEVEKWVCGGERDHGRERRAAEQRRAEEETVSECPTLLLDSHCQSAGWWEWILEGSDGHEEGPKPEGESEGESD
jgi:hypothetical protein